MWAKDESQESWKYLRFNLLFNQIVHFKNNSITHISIINTIIETRHNIEVYNSLSCESVNCNLISIK